MAHHTNPALSAESLCTRERSSSANPHTAILGSTQRYPEPSIPSHSTPAAMDAKDPHETQAAYNIYAKQLFGRRHGYPLWEPEPHKGVETQLGDVGWLYGGRFFRLFSAIRPPDDPSQSYGTPHDHVHWKVKPIQLAETKGAIKSYLCSQSVTSFNLDGQLARCDLRPFSWFMSLLSARDYKQCNRPHRRRIEVQMLAGAGCLRFRGSARRPNCAPQKQDVRQIYA